VLRGSLLPYPPDALEPTYRVWWWGRDQKIRKAECKEMAMTVQQATAEVFLTAFKALPRREQEDILGRIARDRRLRRILEDISDRVAIEEERGKPSRPLRDYVAERERRERGGLKTAR
jgi:hypothetical protein